MTPDDASLSQPRSSVIASLWRYVEVDKVGQRLAEEKMMRTAAKSGLVNHGPAGSGRGSSPAIALFHCDLKCLGMEDMAMEQFWGLYKNS
jgi:hypothetical protein